MQSMVQLMSHRTSLWNFRHNFAFATFDNGNILHVDDKEIKVNSKIFIENFRKDFSNIFDFYYDKSTNIF